MGDVIAIFMGVPIWMWFVIMVVIFIVGSFIHWVSVEIQFRKLMRSEKHGRN